MPAVLNAVEWQTCLRRILFVHAGDSAAIIESIQNGELRLLTIEVFRGHDAYRFLLETICGLNSPIVGETAVMGQFKEFSQRAKFQTTPWGRFLRQLTLNLMMDAKRVRTRHLQGLGSQSYGSLVRQEVKGLPTVAVLGAGKLAREILRENASEPPSLEALAGTVGVHPVYLARQFRRRYHCTIGEYLRQLRIEAACREISGAQIPLSVVAANAGFYDQSHFSNTFKRYTGMTPTQYRAITRLAPPGRSLAVS